MSKLFLRSAAALFALMLSVSAVEAHSHLKASDPAADAIVAASPAAIRLTFSMPLVVKFSGIKLVDGAGKEIAVADATSDPQDKKQLVIALPTQLAPGEYTVEWHAVSVDSHRMTGSFKFRIEQ